MDTKLSSPTWYNDPNILNYKILATAIIQWSLCNVSMDQVGLDAVDLYRLEWKTNHNAQWRIECKR